MARKAIEQTGLIPRSIIRTFDRFIKQLFPETEKLIIQEFKISRYQFLVSIKCLFTLIFIPLITNYLVKNFILLPIIENLWNTRQSEIFLNLYQQDRAFHELKNFQEKIYFDYLINDVTNVTENNLFCTKYKKNDFVMVTLTQPELYDFPKLCEVQTCSGCCFATTTTEKKPTFSENKTKLNNYLSNKRNFILNETSFLSESEFFQGKNLSQSLDLSTNFSPEKTFEKSSNSGWQYVPTITGFSSGKSFNSFSIENELNLNTAKLKAFPKENPASLEIFQQKLYSKTIELANYYNEQSIWALTNLVGDFITFIILSLLLIYLKAEIIILKSFLTESIYSLNDTKKSFLLILGTDLLVGFHSPRGWEICLELVLKHFGFPENKNFVFLFVASFPVLLDTIFKYWVFRYLNKISPSTVATYHSMIE